MKSQNYSDMFEEDSSKDWKKSHEEKLTDNQSLFRSLISDQATDIYYSLCQNDVCDSGNDWHWSIRRKCMDWRRAGEISDFPSHKSSQVKTISSQVKPSSYGSSLPCERCGDSNTDSELSDFFKNID
ncbi:unnamed protein product [Rotaria magnacalcarata]|uniref:Uncharacterized protein n=1 Tax=Rotaria magnacalcarata TaxID=392030 RepID=A0A816SDS1_9BILA|nr:unnamed protein product [Rotaria magnacalcarata]CAF4228556.1 unnamed protein product [Rotaria magnacalcarata]